MKTTPWREIRDKRIKPEDEPRIAKAQRALQAAEEESERSGAGATVLEEDARPTFEESLDILASVDFPPREDAWR